MLVLGEFAETLTKPRGAAARRNSHPHYLHMTVRLRSPWVGCAGHLSRGPPMAQSVDGQ